MVYFTDIKTIIDIPSNVIVGSAYKTPNDENKITKVTCIETNKVIRVGVKSKKRLKERLYSLDKNKTYSIDKLYIIDTELYNNYVFTLDNAILLLEQGEECILKVDELLNLYTMDTVLKILDKVCKYKGCKILFNDPILYKRIKLNLLDWRKKNNG